MLGEHEKIRFLDTIQIDLQPVRLLIKEWVSERSLSCDSKTPIMVEIHWLDRGWVHPPYGKRQYFYLCLLSRRPKFDTHVRVLLQLDDVTFRTAAPAVLGVASSQLERN